MTFTTMRLEHEALAAKDEARTLRKLLWALLETNGPLVVTDDSLAAYDDKAMLQSRYDPATKRTWFEVKR